MTDVKTTEKTKTTKSSAKSSQMSSLLRKIQSVRLQIQNTNLRKSGHNDIGGFNYFELSDFVPKVNELFEELGLFSRTTFVMNTTGSYDAVLSIYDIEHPDCSISFTTPVSMSTSNKNPIQNLGATHTYIRRYLWMIALEIVENDQVDCLKNGSVNETRAVLKDLKKANEQVVREVQQQANIQAQAVQQQPVMQAQVVQQPVMQQPMMQSQPQMVQQVAQQSVSQGQVASAQQMTQQPMMQQAQMAPLPQAQASIRPATLLEKAEALIESQNPYLPNPQNWVGCPMSQIKGNLNVEQVQTVYPSLLQWFIQCGTAKEKSVAQSLLNDYMNNLQN